MKKALPELSITNELKGQSAFFSRHALPPVVQSPPIEPRIDIVRTPERANARTTEQAHARTGEHPNDRPPERPKPPSGQRAIKRQSYNVYQDQHEALKRLEATSSLSGKNIFISEMVREALDQYLQKHK